MIGLTGYAGVGKTAAGEILKSLGAEVVNADRLGHAALADAAVQAQLRDFFGDGIFTGGAAAREVDRKTLGGLVFADSAKLAFLESVSHPWIAARVREAAARAGEKPLVVDAALLKVLALDAEFSRILLVTAPWETRLARVRGRGWDADELRRRDAALAGKTYSPGEPKVVPLANDGGLDALREKIVNMHLFAS